MTQTFRKPISVSGGLSEMTWKDAWVYISSAIHDLNHELQSYLSVGELQSADFITGTLKVVKNPKITGIELEFQRDTGRVDGCTGEVLGVHEDRHHNLILHISFEEPTTSNEKQELHCL
jgi:hypothetical protein